MSVSNFVKSFINNNKIVIFSKSFCPFCKLAKDILIKSKVNDAAIMELDHCEKGAEIQKELTKLNNFSTVPFVYINQICIGGGSDRQKLFQSGELKKLLENH